MIQAFSVIIPIICLLLSIYLFKWNFKSKFLWILFGSSLFISSLCCIGIPLAAANSKSYFNEIWSCKNLKVQYYEDWDERVSCRHPIYKTEYYYENEYDSAKGKYIRVRKSREVLVGYRHSYDVDYHSEYYTVVDEYGTSLKIDKNTYNSWVNIWGNSKFVELNRKFHENDGNMHESTWTGDFDKIYPKTSIHTYENRVRASDSVFNHQKPTKELLDKYKRPSDTDMIPILYYGLNPNDLEIWRLKQLNAELGVNKKIYIIVLFFNAEQYNNQEIENVKSAWGGPNKNELVICIGRKSNDEIVWCDVFSWMDDTTGHAKIRQKVLEDKIFKLETFIINIRDNVNKYWIKKDFREFSYLTIESPMWSKVLSVILSLVLSCGLGVLIRSIEVDV